MYINYDEVNVKEIEYVYDDSGIVSKTARPNFPVLGKRHGKRMKPVAAAIRDLSTTDISNLEKDGLIHIDLEDGPSVKITLEEVEIQRTGLESWSVETEEVISVAVDTDLTPELLQDELSREFVNRIQNMRKQSDFKVTDRISIGFAGSDELKQAVQATIETIKSETVAEEVQLSLLDVSDFIKKWEINGHETEISIRRTITQ